MSWVRGEPCFVAGDAAVANTLRNKENVAGSNDFKLTFIGLFIFGKQKNELRGLSGLD